jgi:hypothetical protein
VRGLSRRIRIVVCGGPPWERWIAPYAVSVNFKRAIRCPAKRGEARLGSPVHQLQPPDHFTYIVGTEILL